MTTDKMSQGQSLKSSTTKHPLADIASKFGGKFWQETKEEIQRFKKAEKEEINQLLDNTSDEQG